MNFYCMYSKDNDLLVIRFEPEFAYSLMMEYLCYRISGGVSVNTSFKIVDGRTVEDKKTVAGMALIDFAAKAEEYSKKFAKDFDGIDLYKEVYEHIPEGAFHHFFVNFYDNGAGGHEIKRVSSLTIKGD